MCVRISNANLLRSDFPCIFAVPVVCSLLLLPLLHRFGSICWLWLIYKICFEAPHLTHGPELIPLDKIPASAFNCCTFAAHFPPGPVPHSAQANGRQLIGCVGRGGGVATPTTACWHINQRNVCPTKVQVVARSFSLTRRAQLRV